MKKVRLKTEVERVAKANSKDLEVQYKDGEKPNNSEFLAMIKESEGQIKEGKTVKFKPGTSLWDLVIPNNFFGKSI